MLYNAPNWTNDSAPAINAENLQAISDTLEQDGNEIQTLQTQQANPFNYKGVVANVASLPSSGNTINDTYYVTAATCLYSWNGSAWSVSSMSEVDYMATLQNIMDDIAEEYDATSAYSVGDYCIYNEKLYKCNTAITTAEAWTSGHWTRVSVTQGIGADITGLKSALVDQDLLSLPYIPRHTGMMNLAGTAWLYTDNPAYQHIILSVEANVPVEIKVNGTGAYWAFLKSYNISAAPDLSSSMSRRSNVDFSGNVPSDAVYLYVNVKNNGTETTPTTLVVDDWNYKQSAKSQILKAIDLAIEASEDTDSGNTPAEIINGNRILISKTNWSNGTINIGYKEPYTMILGGSYASGAQRISLLTGTLKANTKYTFLVKNKDGLVPAVGIADSKGFITYNGEKVETNIWGTAIVFETGSSALTGVYAYLRGSASSLNNEVAVFVVEGELTSDDFYIENEKTPYQMSRLYGKKVAWYGDSIIQGYAWCTTVNGLFSFTATNCGSGGSRISYTDQRNDSMCLATRMQGNYTPTSGTATAIPSDVEVIFVEGGTNDWGNSVNIGDEVWTETPDNTIFAPACHQMFENLTTLFPNAEIIVLGSPWAKWANHFSSDTYGILNNNDLQTVDYGDALLNVAGRWGIKGINMSRLLGFNDNNITSYTSDGIHPNTSGSSIIADNVAKYLLSL